MVSTSLRGCPMKTFAAALALAALAACGSSPKDDCGDCCAAPAKQVVDKTFLKPADSRTFSIEYVGKVPEVPAGTKKLRVWLPVPQDSTVQSINDLSFS